MIIREQIDIALPPEPIWEMLRFAEYLELWNPKCVRSTGPGRELRVGDRFQATHKLSRETTSDVEVLAMVPQRELVLRYYPREMGGYVDETITLEPISPTRTRVRHATDMTHSSIPKWVRPLIWFLTRFGKKTGPGPLDGLRDAAIAQAGM